MATPTPLSAQKGLRATKTPQAYDRKAAEERRQIMRQYREQELRNQELRESEARERQETAEREYAAYKDSADRLRAAESNRASAAAAFNAIRDRFNAAQTAEEQKRLEPELLPRADEYNAAAKNLERSAFRYNASVNAAKQARVISADAQTVSYKADRLDVTFEKVEKEEEPAEQPAVEETTRKQPLPKLSLPESPGPVVGQNLAGTALYVPAAESKRVVEGTQTVTTPGTVANTASLIITDPEQQPLPTLSLPESTGPVVGANLAGDGVGGKNILDANLNMRVEDAFSVQNALAAADDLRKGVGKRLIVGGTVLTESNLGLVGMPLTAAGRLVLDPSQIQKDNSEAEKERQEQEIGASSSFLIGVGEALSERTGTELGAPLVALGKDMQQNLPYATEGIQITDKGVENLPSPGASVLMGITTGALLGAAGAASAFAGGFGNPVNLVRPAAPLVIEGEAVTGGLAGGSAGGGAVVSAGETVGKTALAGISLLADGYGNAGFYSDREVDGAAGVGLMEGSELKIGSFNTGRFSPSELQGENKIFPGDEMTADLPAESYPDRNAEETPRDQKQEEARKTTGATAAASALSFSTTGRISNSELDVNDYINVVITPEITREEYAKRTPFVEVTKNPYEYSGQNKVKDVNRFESYFAYDFPAEAALRTKRRKLPDINLPESKKRKQKQPKSAGKGDDYYYATNWLPKASDLFGSQKPKRGAKKSETDALFRQTKRKGRRLI